MRQSFFFNAPYFKRELLEMAKTAPSALRWIVLDMLPITMIDATGLETTQQLAGELGSRGIGLAAAGRRTEWLLWAESRKFRAEVEGEDFPNVEFRHSHLFGRRRDCLGILKSGCAENTFFRWQALPASFSS
jgi:MFS superfamily sulfate permease-like transporter